jgi:Protein of unknown function (DUF3891)
MILHPTSPAAVPPARKTPVPAWDAVSRTQKQPASSWWLIAQPDHAALAGDLAANLVSPDFPKLDSEVLEAIALHDAGWAQFDTVQLPKRTISDQSPHPSPIQNHRPLSFLDIKPADFLVAWIGSIKRAARSSAIGGILVSHHFSRIAQTRLSLAGDPVEDRERIHHFLAGEAERRRDLGSQTACAVTEIELLVDVLQFCDLLSLYLCCGALEPVEFPQKFAARAIRIRHEEQMYVTTPSIFGSGVSLGVTARPFPASTDPHRAVTIPFLLS